MFIALLVPLYGSLRKGDEQRVLRKYNCIVVTPAENTLLKDQ